MHHSNCLSFFFNPTLNLFSFQQTFHLEVSSKQWEKGTYLISVFLQGCILPYLLQHFCSSLILEMDASTVQCIHMGVVSLKLICQKLIKLGSSVQKDIQGGGISLTCQSDVYLQTLDSHQTIQTWMENKDIMLIKLFFIKRNGKEKEMHSCVLKLL